MSDPVKSSEIEDVLASIRRLVSEEARGDLQARRTTQTLPVPEAPRTVADEDTADALVLTPALRVLDGRKDGPEADAPAASELAAEAGEPDQSPAKPDTVEEQTEDAPEAAAIPDLPDESQTLETKIAALEALIASDVEDRLEAAKPKQDIGPEPDDVTTDDDDAPEPATLDWEDHSPETVDEFDWSGDLAEADADALADETAKAGATLAEPQTEPEDADDGHPAAPVSEAPDAAVVPDDSPIAATEGEPASALDTTDPSAAEVPDAELVDDLTSEQIETAIAEPIAASEPDATLEDDADVGEDDEDTLLSDGGEAVTIDEAALRELVIDIVREELQGALGERITRNVRRLVRREIHRALASHELD